MPLASSSSTTSCGFTVICTTFGASWLNLDSGVVSYALGLGVGLGEVDEMGVNIPDRGDLSSNNFPNEIRRMELGEEGRVSQSVVRSQHSYSFFACSWSNSPDRHSRQINSFRVYTLIAKGSLFSTLTDRLRRYFPSIVNGCRDPVVSNSVMSSDGPPSSFPSSDCSCSDDSTPSLGSSVSIAGDFVVSGCATGALVVSLAGVVVVLVVAVTVTGATRSPPAGWSGAAVWDWDREEGTAVESGSVAAGFSEREEVVGSG